MIKKRLVQLLSHAKKYVFLQVLFNWLALWCQIAMIRAAADIIGVRTLHLMDQEQKSRPEKKEEYTPEEEWISVNEDWV